MISYDILIPAYNAERHIGELLLQIEKLTDPPCNIFIIDDGSTDNTVSILRDFNVNTYRQQGNQGKGSALKKGFELFLNKSKSEYLICMDADLQHPVSSIDDFLHRIYHDRSMFLIGNRSGRAGKMPLHRILSNTITSALLSVLTGQRIRDSQCGFRLMHRNVLQEVGGQLKENGFQVESEFIVQAARHGFQVEFVDIPTLYGSEHSSIRNIFDTFRFIRFILRNAVK